MKGKRRPKPPSTHYSMMDELLASTSQPMPQRNRDYQLKQMNDALQELMQAPRPTNNAWRIVSDAVNLLETLVQHGEAPIKDATGNVITMYNPKTQQFDKLPFTMVQKEENVNENINTGDEIDFNK